MKMTAVDLAGLAAQQPSRRLNLVRRPSGEVAAERAFQLAWDIGADFNGNTYGWKAFAARRMGMNYSTCLSLINGETPSLSTKSVDAIARATGVPVSALYDPEYR